MTIEILRKKLEQKLDAIKAYADANVPKVIGAESIKEFRSNFVNESFDGKKWKDVVRRDPKSPWYGHSGQTGKKSNSRKSAKILDGETGELRNATSFRTNAKSVTILNDKPYAAVHNEGLMAKIYGKKEFTMPKRQFVGITKQLEKNITDKIERDLTRIINS